MNRNPNKQLLGLLSIAFSILTLASCKTSTTERSEEQITKAQSVDTNIETLQQEENQTKDVESQNDSTIYLHDTKGSARVIYLLDSSNLEYKNNISYRTVEIYKRKGDIITLRFKLKGEEEYTYLEMDLKTMLLTDKTNKNNQPIFYNPKHWYYLLVFHFPEDAPEILPTTRWDLPSDWKSKEFRGDYYTSNLLIECESPHNLEETYKLFSELDSSYKHLLLKEIPSRDTIYESSDQSACEYSLEPTLKITYTHPSAAQDHISFEEQIEGGTKVVVEIEPN